MAPPPPAGRGGPAPAPVPAAKGVPAPAPAPAPGPGAGGVAERRASGAQASGPGGAGLEPLLPRDGRAGQLRQRRRNRAAEEGFGRRRRRGPKGAPPPARRQGPQGFGKALRGAGKEAGSAGQRRLNRALVETAGARNVLELTASWMAAGHALSTVNTSTALHRLAQHARRDGAGAEAAVVQSPAFAALKGLALEQLGSMDNQALANTMWAFGALPAACAAECGGGLEPYEAEVARRVESLDGPELTQILWALATLGRAPRATLDACTARLVRIARRLKPGEVSILVWAFAKMGHRPDEAALPVLVDVCLVQMVAFKAQELANCLWGFASMGVYPGDEFLRALSQEARSRPGAEFSASNVAQMLWGFAALSYEPDLAALEFFSAQIEARLPEFSAQGLSMVLWSYARLGTGPDRQTLDALVGQCDVGRMNLQDLTNIMWSLVVMRHYSPAGTAFICEAWEALEGYAPGAFSTAALSSVAYVWLAAQKELPGREWRLPARVEADALRVWKEGVRKASGSDLQREVAAALDAMGFGTEEEAAVEDGFFSVDVLIANQRVVIEVDGPSHFAANNPAKVLGPTMLRRRLLRLHGYTVVTVGYREWDATAGDLGEQVSLLARVLTCEVYPRLLGETSLA